MFHLLTANTCLVFLTFSCTQLSQSPTTASHLVTGTPGTPLIWNWPDTANRTDVETSKDWSSNPGTFQSFLQTPQPPLPITRLPNLFFQQAKPSVPGQSDGAPGVTAELWTDRARRSHDQGALRAITVHLQLCRLHWCYFSLLTYNLHCQQNRSYETEYLHFARFNCCRGLTPTGNPAPHSCLINSPCPAGWGRGRELEG